METIAEGDDETRCVTLNQRRKPLQRRHSVIGWQQDTTLGEGGPFLEMKIGDNKQAFIGQK